MTDDAVLWRPDPARLAASNIKRFMAAAENRHGVQLRDFSELHRWSVERAVDFWPLVWESAGIIAETRGAVVVREQNKLPGAKWFPDAKLNFAENLLRRRDDSPALIFRGEDQVAYDLSFKQLYDQVSRLQQALQDLGVGQGDRVAGYLPNLPETIIAMLATASLGAIWSSCSPDFGVQGVLDRFGQIEPKVLFITDGYFYGGKVFDNKPKVARILAELPGLAKVICVAYVEAEPDLSGLAGAVTWASVLAAHEPREINFNRIGFNEPLYIMYSSGTTGKPKCIVHGAGGTLLQHVKEQQLHCDLKPGDRFFYFTTCGWMMWNWLVSGLASQATLLLYDGMPFHPDGNVLFDFAQDERITHFGTSAKWIDSIAKAGLKPIESHDLSAMRMMLSTGSPLAPQGFDYVYQNVKSNVQLCSISGGTDIVSCFMGGNPLSPVHRGEIQGPGLGMDVRIFDHQGQAVCGAQGELVCVNSFPCMPIRFWNDPDGAKYQAAYFDVYPNVWRHGDWTEQTVHGGFIIHGRSDTTLNPGGVRIGTAEIYRQVEPLDELLEALVIGQIWDNDTRVVLFVRLRQGVALSQELQGRIRAVIRAGASPRHVPAKIIAVADIPRTLSGKITEWAVTDVVHGRPVKNREALANPEALELFTDLAELRD